MARHSRNRSQLQYMPTPLVGENQGRPLIRSQTKWKIHQGNSQLQRRTEPHLNQPRITLSLYYLDLLGSDRLVHPQPRFLYPLHQPEKMSQLILVNPDQIIGPNLGALPLPTLLKMDKAKLDIEAGPNENQSPQNPRVAIKQPLEAQQTTRPPEPTRPPCLSLKKSETHLSQPFTR